MSEVFSGGCGCGAIRYQIKDKPMVMNDCQCRDCQQVSVNVKTHAFCPTCGVPVYLTFAAMPDLFTVHAASLDVPSQYNPQMVTFVVSGYAWDKIDPSLPKYDKMPT